MRVLGSLGSDTRWTMGRAIAQTLDERETWLRLAPEIAEALDERVSVVALTPSRAADGVVQFEPGGPSHAP